MENQQQLAPQTEEPADATEAEKTERKRAYKVVPLVNEFAPGVNPDNSRTSSTKWTLRTTWNRNAAVGNDTNDCARHQPAGVRL